jgi:hypothetical protein
MTCQTDCTLTVELLEQIADRCLDPVPELIRAIINTSIRLERPNHLHCLQGCLLFSNIAGRYPINRPADRQCSPRFLIIQAGVNLFRNDLPAADDGEYFTV